MAKMWNNCQVLSTHIALVVMCVDPANSYIAINVVLLYRMETDVHGSSSLGHVWLSGEVLRRLRVRVQVILFAMHIAVELENAC